MPSHRVFLDAGIVLASALTLLTLIGETLRIPLAAATLSISNPIRPALVALALTALRVALTRRHASETTTAAIHLPCLALATASVGYWLLHLTTIAGGADSYGYISAAALLGGGALSHPQPDAAWLPVANALNVLTPLGYVPAADSTIVPLYPLGFPALIAVASLVLPAALAPYVVAPAMAVAVLVLVFLIARRLVGNPAAAWLAVALAAWDPLVISYAKQPMSDIPAAAWLLLATWCLVRSTPLPALAGLAAGLSFLTRPGGLGAIAAVGLLAAIQWRAPRRALLAFAAALSPCIALQAVLQWRLFGSPWHTGYGSLGALYGGTSLFENAAIYARALVTLHTLLWVVLAALGLYTLRRNRAAMWTLVLFGASLVPYLLYLRFDHWETLRFVLPAIVLLDIMAAAGALTLIAHMRPGWTQPAAITSLAVVACLHSVTFLEREGVLRLMDQEQRYVAAADWIERFTPAEAMVLAGQHSGSLRHYAGRTTIRWDLLLPADLEPVVREARRRGRPVYTALDDLERPPFRERFAAALAPSAERPGAVRLVPGGQVRDVQIWELITAEAPP